jgi:ABC-type multidrug transport system ATPase subunit
MVSSEPLIALKEVTKSFGSRKVIQRVSLEVLPGECVLLLGANGAGKSTLLRLMSGLSRADSGSVRASQGARVGYVSDFLFLYPRLTVRENVQLFQVMSVAGRDPTQLLEEWRLSALLNTRVHELSKGNQVRVSLVCALLGNPQILLLDEPSSHLDDAGVEVLSHTIAVVSKGVAGGLPGAVVLVTHDIARLQQLATRAMVLNSGKIASDTGCTVSPAIIEQSILNYRSLNR